MCMYMYVYTHVCVSINTHVHIYIQYLHILSSNIFISVILFIILSCAHVLLYSDILFITLSVL